MWRGDVEMRENPRARVYEALGVYIRSQRQLARLSLRQAAALARISNPYLSQIEHGLALPSVTVLNALAGALEVSVDDLLLRAAGVKAGDASDRVPTTEQAIRHDPRLNPAQQAALLAVLSSYVGSSPSTPTTPGDGGASPAVGRAPRPRQAPKAPAKDGKVHNHA